MASRALYACLYISRSTPRPGALAAVAREFSARIEARSDRLVLCDVSGLERLFGDVQAIGVELGRAAVGRGLAPRVAVAGTRVAAWLVACARAGLTVVRPGTEAAAVASLPIAALAALVEAAPGEARPPRRAVRRRGATRRHYRLAPAPATSAAEAGCSRPEEPSARCPAPGLRSSSLGQARRSVAEAASALDDLPSLLSTLSRWGVRTLGELAALPPAALSARLGAAGPALCRLARGEDPCPLVPDPEAARFEASLDLEWPVEQLEPLSFVLARLLEPLAADLERADRGAVRLTLELRLVTRERWTRTLDLPAPIRDPRVLRTLLLLDLESHPPPAGIDQVTVKAESSPGRIVQYSLIERPLPSPERISTLMARLNALMGTGRVGAPVLVDSHRPGAFEIRGFTPGVSGPRLRANAAETVEISSSESRRLRSSSLGGPAVAFAKAGVPSPDRVAPGVLRRFRVPVVATVVADRGRPVRVTTGRRSLPGGRVVQAAGPWRTSGEWWRSSAWDRDEWDVLVADGAIYRLSRHRAKGRWTIEGVVD